MRLPPGFLDPRLGSVEALDPPALRWRTRMGNTKTKPPTKSDKVIAQLSRAQGASLDEICSNTGWQPHSARAFMTGLRKKGFIIVRDKLDAGGSIYRITGKALARQKVKQA